MKNTSFNKYLNKEKLKGNYSSKLDESLINEGLWDSIKKGAHWLANGSDNMYYRIECDLTGKKVKDYFRDYVVKKLKKEEDKAKNDADRTDAGNKQDKTLNNSENAKQYITDKLKNLLTELAKGKYKGYLYPWIAGNKVYFYFDNEEHARRCYNNNILQNEKINLDESILKTIFTITKKELNSQEVKKLKKSGGNVGSNANINNFTDFLDKQTDEIYDAIKESINDLIQKENTNVVWQVTLKLSDDDCKKLIQSNGKDVESSEIPEKIINSFKDFITEADLSTDFLYISGTKQGNLIFSFSSEKAIRRFVEDFSQEDIGTLGEPTNKDIDKEVVDKRKTNPSMPKAFSEKINNMIKADNDNGAVQFITFKLKPDNEIETAYSELEEPSKELPTMTIFESKFMAFGKKFDKIVLTEAGAGKRMVNSEETAKPASKKKTVKTVKPEEPAKATAGKTSKNPQLKKSVGKIAKAIEQAAESKPEAAPEEIVKSTAETLKEDPNTSSVSPEVIASIVKAIEQKGMSPEDAVAAVLTAKTDKNSDTNLGEVKKQIATVLCKAVDELFKSKKIEAEGPRLKKDGSIVYKFINVSKERVDKIVSYLSGRMSDEIKSFVNEPVSDTAKYKEDL